MCAMERVGVTWIVEAIFCCRFAWSYFNVFSLQCGGAWITQPRIMQEYTFLAIWTSASSNVSRTDLDDEHMVSV